MEIFHVSGESYTKAIQYEKTVHVWENSVKVQYDVGSCAIIIGLIFNAK